MTEEEKRRLVQGVGWSGWSVVRGFYVGSILGIPRLGLPSINMQDAAQARPPAAAPPRPLAPPRCRAHGTPAA